MLHGEYRTGNYHFDEESGEITALLDWELARIGDYHEDLGWVLMEIFGAFDPDGTFRASDLFEREEFIGEYERRSGRSVNRRTLHYYDVMSSWKCNVIVARSEEHTSELQSLMRISYAVFCFKKKTIHK